MVRPLSCRGSALTIPPEAMTPSLFHTPALLVALLLLCASCGTGDASATAAAAADSTAAVAQQPSLTPGPFDTDSAMALIETQTLMGPRVPGTEAHTRAHDWITGRLKALGATVTTQGSYLPFDGIDGFDAHPRNIFASFYPGRTRRVMLLAHYDTRPVADRDPDPANRNTPIDGANDGASGVAVMLEIARNIAANDPGVGVDLLFTDCEDGGIDAPDGADNATHMLYENTWCVGARQWAATQRFDTTDRPAYAILLDMVGGKGASFDAEYFSTLYAPDVVKRIRDTAAALGYGHLFGDTRGAAINDDHLPLNNAGIPTADIIDTRNGQGGSFIDTWHTLGDNFANIDPRTLKTVGTVVSTIIYNDTNTR